MLQTISQKLFEKSQRIKDYEKKRIAELDERELRIEENEKLLNKEHYDFNLIRSLKTEDLFNYAQNEEINTLAG